MWKENWDAILKADDPDHQDDPQEDLQHDHWRRASEKEDQQDKLEKMTNDLRVDPLTFKRVWEYWAVLKEAKDAKKTQQPPSNANQQQPASPAASSSNAR